MSVERNGGTKAGVANSLGGEGRFQRYVAAHQPARRVKGWKDDPASGSTLWEHGVAVWSQWWW